MSLFYIAFIIQDLDMLKSQLATMLITQQAFNHIQEAFLPLIIRRYMQKVAHFKKSIFHSKTDKTKTIAVPTNPEDNIPQMLSNIPVDEEQCRAAQKQGIMEPYEGTFDDYLEMFVQFGYVVLFSSVYPIAAFFGVINNLIEIRADAFKVFGEWEYTRCRTRQMVSLNIIKAL